MAVNDAEATVSSTSSQLRARSPSCAGVWRASRYRAPRDRGALGGSSGAALSRWNSFLSNARVGSAAIWRTCVPLGTPSRNQ
jgi:hypothetical protein